MKSMGSAISGADVTVTANAVSLERATVTAKEAVKLSGAEGVTITSNTNSSDF